MNHNEIIPWTEDSGKSRFGTNQVRLRRGENQCKIDWFQDEANFSTAWS